MISTGHAALELAPDIYISHYPALDLDHSPAEFARLFRASPDNNVKGHFQPSYAFESADWCPADARVDFHMYDAARLRAHWETYCADDTYNLTNRNCSVSVAVALEAALEGTLGTRAAWGRFWRLLVNPDLWFAALLRARAELMTWTPGLVLDYARALRELVEPQRRPWRRRLQVALLAPAAAARRDGEAAGMTAAAAAPAARGHLPSLAAVIATAAVFGLTYSLSAALLALDLAERGAPRSLIGLNAAMHALGVLAIAPVLPRVVGRIGPRRMTLGALVVAAVVLALFPAVPGIWLWFPLRFLLGAASEALFTLSETWVSQLSEERTRARLMATYVAALSVGFALGPLILSAIGSAGRDTVPDRCRVCSGGGPFDRLAEGPCPGLTRTSDPATCFTFSGSRRSRSPPRG